MELAKDPGAQTWHSTAPTSETAPKPQLAQVELPERDWNRPDGQIVQVLDPCVEKRPGGQGVHVSRWASLYVPA
jgi:hypothetical protein